jgi:hypothetical protein
MDPANRPSPFKRYRRLERQPLPTDLEPPAGAPSALEVLSGHLPRNTGHPTPTALDRAVLARLLYLSAGVTRYTEEGRRRSGSGRAPRQATFIRSSFMWRAAR